MIAETLALVVDNDVLARIAGAIGDAARERARDLAKLDESSSRATRASWLAAARAPIPAGLRGIDASWIEAAIGRVSRIECGDDTRDDVDDKRENNKRLDVLALRARRVLFDGPTNAGDVWLARWVCASLPAIPAIDPRIVRPRSGVEALSMSAANLRAWLEDVGADTIAFAVGKAATAMSSRLGAAAVRIGQAPRVGEMGERRSAIERARIAIDEGALLRVGARTIAARLGQVERWQLAHRFPRETGVWTELEVFAASTGTPSWRALAAS